MKILLSLVIFLIPFVGITQIKSALFLGNSYTFYNNMPQLVADIANSNGDSLFFDSNTPGGYTLQGHSTDPTSTNKIKTGDWDFVVLQEQSQRPSFPPAQVQTDVFPYAKILDSLIDQNDTCAETMFFMTWGRKYGDASNCAFYPPLCTYQGMQQRLRDSYVQMAVDNDASVAPVGQAWKNSIAADSNLNLYSPDNSHPSIYGSYLTACVFYASMYHKPSFGSYIPSSVGSATGLFLQGIADQTVFDSLNTWRIDTVGSIWADFDHDINFMTAKFYGKASDSTASFYWDFGDGTTSSLQNPTHIFQDKKLYYVCLTVTKGCKSDTYCDGVDFGVFVDDNKPLGSLKISPNPTSKSITIRAQSVLSELSLEILNVRGQLLQSHQCFNCKKFNLDIPGPSGLYFLTVSDGNEKRSFKILKE